MTKSKRMLSRLLVWFLVITLVPFALPGTVEAKDRLDKKQQRCVMASTGTATLSGACVASLSAAKGVCVVAPFTAAFDLGAASGMCVLLVGTAALSCSVSVPLLLKAVNACW